MIIQKRLAYKKMGSFPTHDLHISIAIIFSRPDFSLQKVVIKIHNFSINKTMSRSCNFIHQISGGFFLFGLGNYNLGPVIWAVINLGYWAKTKRRISLNYPLTEIIFRIKSDDFLQNKFWVRLGHTKKTKKTLQSREMNEEKLPS